MQFTYIGDGDDCPSRITFMGRVYFELNIPVDVQDGELIAKLNGNKCFRHGDNVQDNIIDVEPTYGEKYSALKAAGVELENRTKSTVNEAYEKLEQNV